MPLILLAFLAFIGIALPDGVLGVAWPSMRISLDQPVGALGLLLPFAVVSSMLSSASTGFVLGRIGLGRLLAVSTALSAMALLTQSVAPDYWIVIAAAVVFAVGSGAIDSALNAYAARTFSARDINWMHACYGLGAAAGPLIVAGAAAGGLSWRWAFAAVGAVQGLLVLAFAATASRWETPPSAERGPAARAETGLPRAGSRRPRAIWSGVPLFALETGLEATASLWAFVFLTEARGLARGTAAAAVSAYWVALVVGRLILGPVADRVGPYRVVVSGLAGMVAGAALLLLPGPGAIVGVMVLGASVAPMFPLFTLTTRDRVGARNADRAIGVQVAASSAGAAILPGSAGVLIGQFGAGILAPLLIVLALATGVVYAAIGARAAERQDA
jgi:fucose permease